MILLDCTMASLCFVSGVVPVAGGDAGHQCARVRYAAMIAITTTVIATNGLEDRTAFI